MRRFTHSFVVDSNIDDVWKFYTDINHLKIITPERMKLEILTGESDILKEDTEWILQARLVTNTRWKSRITYLRPYVYVDEMVSGRFKVWKHMHQFNKITNTKTEIVDRIDFELLFGIVGKLLENYVMQKLYKIFEFRKNITIETLQKELQV